MDSGDERGRKECASKSTKAEIHRAHITVLTQGEPGERQSGQRADEYQECQRLRGPVGIAGGGERREEEHRADDEEREPEFATSS